MADYFAKHGLEDKLSALINELATGETPLCCSQPPFAAAPCGLTALLLCCAQPSPPTRCASWRRSCSRAAWTRSRRRS